MDPTIRIVVGDLIEVVDATHVDLVVGSRHYVADADARSLKIEGQDGSYLNWRFVKVSA